MIVGIEDPRTRAIWQPAWRLSMGSSVDADRKRDASFGPNRHPSVAPDGGSPLDS